VAKPATSPKPSVAANGYVMMRTNTLFFHLPGIAAPETTANLPFVVIITPRSTPATGRIARSAGMILRQRCMCITALMNTTLKSSKIFQSISLPNAASAARLSCWAKVDIRNEQMNTGAKNAQPLNFLTFLNKMKALYKHKRSGDLFAIETDDAGRVISTSGPLLVKDLNPEQLDYDIYWNPDINANIEGFELLSQAEYKELLKRTGFFIQESQRSIFSELDRHKKKKRK
jgi:hypothetical protein